MRTFCEVAPHSTASRGAAAVPRAEGHERSVSVGAGEGTRATLSARQTERAGGQCRAAITTGTTVAAPVARTEGSRGRTRARVTQQRCTCGDDDVSTIASPATKAQRSPDGIALAAANATSCERSA